MMDFVYDRFCVFSELFGYIIGTKRDSRSKSTLMGKFLLRSRHAKMYENCDFLDPMLKSSHGEEISIRAHSLAVFATSVCHRRQTRSKQRMKRWFPGRKVYSSNIKQSISSGHRFIGAVSILVGSIEVLWTNVTSEKGEPIR